MSDGFKVLAVEQTPNPNAKKFVLDRQVSASPISIRSPGDSANHVMAQRLMSIPGVVGVLLLNDFVTISKSSEARWADITVKAKRIVGGKG